MAKKTTVPVLTPIAFTLGFLAFAFWWNFHEEEFYFQITLPTIVLLSCVRQINVMRWAIIAWAVLLIGNNLVQHAIPQGQISTSAIPR